MYRYIVDNAITYTPEDFVLYRESPFACWMERLTLENPDHGIPSDIGSETPLDCVERQDDLAETLRDEGRDVVLVDWEMDESRRRSATLDAMRKGADFIVNGQLALGPLSGAVNLLMRTSGYSDLGSYLYVPCDTQGTTTLHAGFRLCFLADLLHMLQGQLPPQMLIIRGGSDVVPLESEEHIYHYRAVKQRFMKAMREFRKHRMPDPSESAHFGRWSDCAHEVMKQRALNSADDDSEEMVIEEEPVLAAAESGGAQAFHSTEAPVDADTEQPILPVSSVAADARRVGDSQVSAPATGTLAEQASRLSGADPVRSSAAAPPGYTPNLAPVMAARPVVEERRRIGDGEPPAASSPEGRTPADIALENLEFIGSNLRPPTRAGEVAYQASAESLPPQDAEPKSTEQQDEVVTAYAFPEQGASLDARGTGNVNAAPAALEREVPAELDSPFELPATRREKRHPLDSLDIPVEVASASVIDRDESAPPAPAPRFSWEGMDEGDGERDFLEEAVERGRKAVEPAYFSDSLITNDEYGKGD